jgi:hypothetical protein
VPIIYDAHSYPYWFQDEDDDGVIDLELDPDSGELEPVSYGDWDVPLFKASFNYQFWQKEPGAWAHNTVYILQLLYDSIDDLDGDLTGLTAPDR